MNKRYDTLLIASCKGVAHASAVFVILLGGMGLAGWILDIAVLRSLIPGGATMKANTALCLIAASIALWLLARESMAPTFRSRRLAQGCAGIVVFVGVLTLGEYFSGLHLGIDQLLFQDTDTTPASPPGRMSEGTAVNFVLLGTALLFLTAGTPRGALFAQWLAVATGFIGLLALIGYLYDAMSLYRAYFYGTMALPTVLAFLVLSAGVLCIRSEEGLMRIVTSPDVEGVVVRRLLPAAIGLPVAFGWMRLYGQRVGFYDTEFGVALFTLAMVIAFTALIVRNAGVIARIAAERKEVEQALSKSERTLASIIGSAMDAIITIDESQCIVLFNAAAEQMFRYTASDVLGQPIDRLIPERFRTPHQEHIRQFGRTGVTARRMGTLGAISGVRAEGQEFPIEAAISQTETADRKFFTVILRDITQRRQAELALWESEERFRRMAETVPDILFTIRPDGWRDYVSPKFYQYTGLPPGSGEGRGWMVALHPDDAAGSRARWLQSLKTGEPYETRHRLRAADGSYRWHLCRAHPIHDAGGTITKWFGVCSDIDDLVRAQEALIQAQKMEAVGQLTGGVAHDFNNLLTIISGNLQMLEEQLRDDAFSRKLVAAATKAAGRGADLVRGLLAFARKQVLQPQAVNLNQLIAGLMPLLHRTLGEHIEVVKKTEDRELWPALADPAQVETALVNLVVNARDAMPTGGKLTIETANVFLDKEYAAREAELSPGEYVFLAVSDTGTGMQEDVRKRVFEPFFTTKETGKGSGLGLSMVYGFAKQSSGHVKIYSEVGHGTTVKLYLPRARIAAKPVVEERVPEAEHPKGRETILVVEDEPGVCELAVAFLSGLGYRVLEAADGPAALARLEEEPAVDLLFVDLVLSGPMSGAQLAVEAQRHQPNLKVLYTSGYPKNAIVHNGRLDEGAHLLPKPYTRGDLAHAVRRLLDVTVK